MNKKILWIYFVYPDLDSHITTWREMYHQLKLTYNIHFLFPFSERKSGFTDTINYIKIPKTLRASRVVFSILAFLKFIPLYQQLKPEYVIIDGWSFFYSIIRKFTKHKAVFILDSRTPYYGQRRKRWENNFLKSFVRLVLIYNKKYHNGLTCISEELRNLYEKDFGFKLNSKFCEWPSGISLPYFKAPLYLSNASSNTIKMLFHGSITHTRGLEKAIVGLKLLKEQQIDFIFHLYGQGYFINKIKEVINDNNLNNEVQILSPIDYTKVPDMICEYNLAIMTYPKVDYWEGNVPLKLLEYIAMKRFVLCTDLKIFKKMAGSYPKMIFLSNNDPVSIKDGVLKYLIVKDIINDEDVEVDSIIYRYSWTTTARDFSTFLESF